MRPKFTALNNVQMALLRPSEVAHSVRRVAGAKNQQQQKSEKSTNNSKVECVCRAFRWGNVHSTVLAVHPWPMTKIQNFYRKHKMTKLTTSMHAIELPWRYNRAMHTNASGNALPHCCYRPAQREITSPRSIYVHNEMTHTPIACTHTRNNYRREWDESSADQLTEGEGGLALGSRDATAGREGAAA